MIIRKKCPPGYMHAECGNWNCRRDYTCLYKDFYLGQVCEECKKLKNNTI